MSDTPNEKNFMREKIVKPPIDKRRAAGRILCYVLFAAVFGGVAAVSFTVQSATQLTAVAPAGSVGTVDVVVTATGGTSDTAGTATRRPCPTSRPLPSAVPRRPPHAMPCARRSARV